LLVPVLFLAAVWPLGRPAAAQDSEGSHCGSDVGLEPARAVVRVIDAETIALDDGSEVRLAGILAPRRPMTVGAVSAHEPYAPEVAARAALGALVLDRSVEMRALQTPLDRYGRRRAHVFAQAQGKRTWVQGALLAQGHARAWGYQDSDACLREMLLQEASAREAGRELWGNAAFAVRAAANVRELMRLRSTFQLVEGRVTGVTQSGGRVYVNFGDDWRTDFTAGVLRRKVVANLERGEIEALRGRRVRVRGFIERRNGPFVEISTWAQVELLEFADVRAAGTSAEQRMPASGPDVPPQKKRTPGDDAGRP
jgi:endonuclease YncB( thermonuclease family)